MKNQMIGYVLLVSIVAATATVTLTQVKALLHVNGGLLAAAQTLARPNEAR